MFFTVYNDKLENAIIDSNGKIIVPFTKHGLTTWDYYNNGTFYFVEIVKSDDLREGEEQYFFYGLGGTKFFK